MKNFGQIKNSFNTILSESVGETRLESKTLFKGYLKQLRESDVLKTQFLIYKNIEDKIEVNETKAIEFVKENIALMQKYTKEEILEANKLLESKIPSSLENVYENDKLKTLHENISTLILTKKAPNTVGTIVETILEVAQFIKTNETKVINEDLGIPNSLLSNIAVDKYNEKYVGLTESHKKAIVLIMESDVAARLDFFKESIKGCLNQINEKLNESDATIKESLLAAKENLLEREFNDETFIKDISKILDLSEDLK